MELILEEKWKNMEEKMEERWVRRKATIEKRCKDILEAALQAKSKEMEEEMEREFSMKQIEIQSRWKNKCDTIQEEFIGITENALQDAKVKCKEVHTAIEEMWREKQIELQEGWIRKMEKLEIRWTNILRETLKEKCRNLTENLERNWDIKCISLSNNSCREGDPTQDNERKENKFRTEENLQEKHMKSEDYVEGKSTSLVAGMRQELQITENIGHLGNEVSGSTGGEEQRSERTLKREKTKGCRKRFTNTNPLSNSSTVIRNEIKNEAAMLTNNTNVQASVESVSQYNFESDGEVLNYKQYDTGVQEETLCKETEPNSRKSSTSDVEVIQNTESVYEHLVGESALKKQCLPLTVQTTKHSSLQNRENIENESGKPCSLQNQSTVSDTSHVKCLMEDRELSQDSDTSSTSDIFERYDRMMCNFFLGKESLNNQLQSPTPPISEQSATSIKSVEEEESTTRRRSRPTQADTKQKRPQDDPEEGDMIRFLPHRQLLLRHRNDQQRVSMGLIKKAERISERCLNKADEDGAKRTLQAEERRRLRLGRKLLGAARAGDADRLLALWHAGAYADAPDRRGETPLHAAAAGGECRAYWMTA
ncbi:Protein of unknown function [Gryllus bimaculatus]|nr:Protein of unknown function [Gryllus bimaculatus]